MKTKIKLSKLAEDLNSYSKVEDAQERVLRTVEALNSEKFRSYMKQLAAVSKDLGELSKFGSDSDLLNKNLGIALLDMVSSYRKIIDLTKQFTKK